MNPHHSCFRRRWVICLLLAIVSVVTLGQVQESIPAHSAGVAEWKGAVNIVLPGQSASQPSRGQQLPAGTFIQTTSGHILLNLSDGSQALIYPHTQVALKQPSLLDPNYLHLLLGRIRAEISKRTGGSPSFQLGTPSAVITVRGTKFLVEVNSVQVTEVDVLEGVVEVTGVHQPAKSVVLQPGFSTRVSMEGDPESPLPTDEIRPDFDRGGENMNDSKSEEGDSFEDLGDMSGSPASNSNIEQATGESTREQSGQNGPDGPNR
jgi:FecR-like protein